MKSILIFITILAVSASVTYWQHRVAYADSSCVISPARGQPQLNSCYSEGEQDAGNAANILINKCERSDPQEPTNSDMNAAQFADYTQGWHDGWNDANNAADNDDGTYGHGCKP